MRLFLEDAKKRGLECGAILDIGANMGCWTRLAAAVYPEAKFFMIEPLEEMRQSLEALCREHPGSRLFVAGAGTAPGELPLTYTVGQLSGSSFLPDANSHVPRTAQRRTVPIVTIDALLDQGELSTPQLVKLDVQGFELEALKGATRLFGQTQVFILETSFYPFINDRRVLFHDVVRFMLERDYVVYDFAGFLRRPLDGALAQCDVVFVPRDSFLRKSSRWG